MNTASNNMSLNLSIKYPGRAWDNSSENEHIKSILDMFKANQLGSPLGEYIEKLGAENASLSYWVASESQVSTVEQTLNTLRAVTNFEGKVYKGPTKSGKGFKVNYQLKPREVESVESLLSAHGL